MKRPDITQFGEKGILLNWSIGISEAVHNSVITYEKWISAEFESVVEDVNSAYHSLLILVRNSADLAPLISAINKYELSQSAHNNLKRSVYKIPTCYDLSFGIDLQNLANQKGLSTDQLIDLFSQTNYKVYFYGFLPGFIYLGGLPQKLHTERLSSPRLLVEKGSVAIGGAQIGVYPQNSPGGWHVLGKTPIDLVQMSDIVPFVFLPGDYVQFESVSSAEFKRIEKEVKLGNYVFRKEVIDD